MLGINRSVDHLGNAFHVRINQRIELSRAMYGIFTHYIILKNSNGFPLGKPHHIQTDLLVVRVTRIRARAVSLLDVFQSGFPDGVDIEADVVERLMVEVVSAVEKECRLWHGVKNLLVIEGLVFLPLG